MANVNLCSPNSSAPGVGSGSTPGDGVRAGESEPGDGKVVLSVRVGRDRSGWLGRAGSGAVGAGLRATTERRERALDVDLPNPAFSPRSAAEILSTDCSPTASNCRILRSLSGLPSACKKLCARPDIPADLVGLLIAAIGLCASVTDDRRLLTTRGEGGTDDDGPADIGPEPVEDDVRAD